MPEHERLAGIAAVEPQDDLALQPALVTERRNRPVKKTSGAIVLPWMLFFILLLGLLALAWWGQQQIEQLKQQIIATQESFAQISEDASGLFHEVSGAVSAEQQQLKNRIEQLQAGSGKLVQEQSRLDSRVDVAASRLAELERQLEGTNKQLQKLGKVLNDGLLSLDQQLQLQASAQQEQHLELQAGQQKLSGQQQLLASQVDSMQELLDLQQEQSQGLQSIAQSMLPQLRELQARQEEFSQELSAFRAQTTRHLNELRTAP